MWLRRRPMRRGGGEIGPSRWPGRR